MPKTSWMFLFLLVFSVYAEDQDLPVVASAKELKGVKAKKIVWETDGAKMVHIPLRIHLILENVNLSMMSLVIWLNLLKLLVRPMLFLWMPMRLM